MRWWSAHGTGYGKPIFNFPFLIVLILISEQHRSLDVFPVVGGAEHDVRGNLALAVELHQGGVHQVVAFAGGGGDDVGDLEGLAFADQVPDGGVHQHDFRCQHTAVAALVGKQLLAENCLQAHGELDPDLGLLLGGEDVHDTVDGIGSGVGMQGGENQVAGFGGHQSGLDGGQVTHLTNQDHVRVCTEQGVQRVLEGFGIGANFPLVDDAHVGLVDVLDGVFQGDDVLVLGVVDLVQQAGQGGGLAGAGLAGDQNDALLELGELMDHLGQAQFIEGGDVVVQQTDGSGHMALLTVDRHTAAGAVGHGDGQILLADLPDLVIMGGHLLAVMLAVGIGHDIVVNGMKLAVNADPNGNAADDMNITGPLATGSRHQLRDCIKHTHEKETPFFKLKVENGKLKVIWIFPIWEIFPRNVIPRKSYALTFTLCCSGSCIQKVMQSWESPGTMYVPAEQYGEWYRECQGTALLAVVDFTVQGIKYGKPIFNFPFSIVNRQLPIDLTRRWS